MNFEFHEQDGGGQQVLKGEEFQSYFTKPVLAGIIAADVTWHVIQTKYL